MSLYISASSPENLLIDTAIYTETSCTYLIMLLYEAMIIATYKRLSALV